ncbi:MAG: hypothetical protein ACOC5T_06320 [Elusimicrobiota bacterium]
MPIPKPKEKESKEEFVKRCVSSKVMNKEYPDREQRYAVCQSQWDKKKED